MSGYALEQLHAKQEITERLHDYVRAMDRMDDELGYSVFHADAVADYGTMYQGTGHGFVDFVHVAHQAMLVHTHQLGGVTIRVDGERAVSESYVTATLRGRAPDGALFEIRSCGRYLDRWEKRAGRWAISARQYVHELDDRYPVHQPGFDTTGRRDRADPSYALFAQIADRA